MPTRKKAKWGYRRRYFLTTDDGVRVYTDEAIREITAKYDITGSDRISKLSDQLEVAGVIYRTWKRNYDDAPNRGEMKAALDEIESLARNLRNRLDQLDDMTAHYFWAPENQLRLLVGDPNAKESRYGHKIFRSPDGEGGQIMSFLEMDELFEAVDILSNYATDAKRRLPQDRRGPRKGEGLRMWAVNAASIWEQIIERAFTLDSEKGQPVSEAARFCVDAFYYVEPGVAPSRVMDAMRKVISRRSRKIAGEDRPQN